ERGSDEVEPFPARSALQQQRDECRADDRADAEEAFDKVHVGSMLAGGGGDIADQRQRARLEDADPQTRYEQQQDEQAEAVARREQRRSYPEQREPKQDRALAPDPVGEKPEQDRGDADARHRGIVERSRGGHAEIE